MATNSLPIAFNLIAGRKVCGVRRDPVINPARLDSVVGHVEIASGETVEAAIHGAADAFPMWAATPLDQRKLLLAEAGKAVERLLRDADLPAMLTAEQGKILAEARRDVGGTSGLIKLNLDAVDGAISDRVSEDERGRNVLVYDPIGVVAIVTPWNWPVLLSVVAVIPALLAGNTVILKPDPNTPLAISETIYAMAAALPPGVLSLVHGGAEVGAQLVAHPKVGKITFVGSVASGRKVYASAAGSSIKRLALELGGNDPAIIFDDARLGDDALRAIVGAAFMTTGQVCMSIKRIYVHTDIVEDFTSRFTDAVNELVVGDGMEPPVTMGPLNNAVQFAKVQRMMDEVRAAGASIHTVGTRHDSAGWDSGHFMLPSVVVAPPETSQLVREEQFGPVIPIMSFSDEDDVVRRANDTEYGLSASIWTEDRERGFSVSRRVQAGKVWLNQHGLGGLDFGIAVGGVKDSGLGVHYGPEGLQAFTNRRLLTDRRL